MDSEAIKMMNIFERMLHISEEIPPIRKDLDVDQGNRKSYSALSERAVLERIRPLESKYRVYSYPYSRNRNSQLLKKEYTGQDGNRRTITLLLDRIDVTYRFVNIDNPEDFIEVQSFGVGLDTGDKGPGKAMTYADKYAITKAYKVCSEDAVDDPDRTASPYDELAVADFDLAPMMPEEGQMVFSQDIGDDWDRSNAVTPFDTSAKSISPQSRVWTPPGVMTPPPVQSAQQPVFPMSFPQVPQQVQEQRTMSVEDAKSFIIPIGTMKGKTIGELLATNRKQVEFYAGDKFRNQKYPDLKRAAQCALQSLKQ